MAWYVLGRKRVVRLHSSVRVLYKPFPEKTLDMSTLICGCLISLYFYDPIMNGRYAFRVDGHLNMRWISVSYVVTGVLVAMYLTIPAAANKPFHVSRGAGKLIRFPAAYVQQMPRFIPSCGPVMITRLPATLFAVL